jgi:HTH-type transcriptional regulator, transcriptional repressor of NAD biosynthesis genes
VAFRTRGLVLGKFLPYHAGHQHLIRTARGQVDRLTVLVCSIDSDPIPGGLRYQWVRVAHPDCRVVWVEEEVPLAPDDPSSWDHWIALIERRAGRVDRLFTSGAYGDELAVRLGAEHVSIDRARAKVPISASAIRRNPMTNWDVIPAHVRPYFVRRVVFLGAESTGKSTLCERLASEFSTTWVAEYGRLYCEQGRPALELERVDLEAIAWGQATWEDEAALSANRILFCDTDLHTTATWSDLTIGYRPDWLTEAARARRYDLMILLDADVPWVGDGTRVLQDRRVEHTGRLREELEKAGRQYVTISGSFDERAAAARRLVDALVRYE